MSAPTRPLSPRVTGLTDPRSTGVAYKSALNDPRSTRPWSKDRLNDARSTGSHRV